MLAWCAAYYIPRIQHSHLTLLLCCLLEMVDTDNPFAGDPERHPALIVHTAQPFNAEPPAALLVDSPTTPNDIFYVRNHLPVPHVDVDAYRVDVEGPTPASFAMDQLKESFAHVRTFMWEKRSTKGRVKVTKTDHVTTCDAFWQQRDLHPFPAGRGHCDTAMRGQPSAGHGQA